MLGGPGVGGISLVSVLATVLSDFFSRGNVNKEVSMLMLMCIFVTKAEIVNKKV